VHVAERGVDAALGSDRVASRGEELGNAGRVEASLGQAECGTQTGTAGTDDERIVLMVLVQPKVNSLCPSDIARIEAEVTYDDGVFAADERRCLLRTERPVGEDAGYRPRAQISTRSPSSHTAPGIGLNLPAGRVVEKARVGARESWANGPRVSQTVNRDFCGCARKCGRKGKGEALTAGAAASRLQAIEEAIVVYRGLKGEVVGIREIF
jgi:hypothetical protein